MTLFKTTLLTLLMVLPLSAAPNDVPLKQKIAAMFVIGFDADSITKTSAIAHDLQHYALGGVILFDRDFHESNRTKNILNPSQLRRLTQQLQRIAPRTLLIGVDQEGGRVTRLKSDYGFEATPSAAAVAAMTQQHAKTYYDLLAKTLHDSGINCNFAPVVDLARNPKNKVIYALERSFGKDPDTVVRYANILIDAQKKAGVISVLKHFPGHGSSLGDSHKGFVDVTQTWHPIELEPYKKLIQSGNVDMIMTAHVYNAALDTQYPATLSYKTNTQLLRHQLHYNGVIISDDLQMSAITKHYSLKEALTLAINAGVDMLLFGNQLAHNDVGTLIDTVYKQVQAGHISMAQINTSYQRIQKLLSTLTPPIIDKPIRFGERRIAMTKAYIAQHYDLNVSTVTIDPKVIVLHWTAVMDVDKAFERLNGETLFSDRNDISHAGALNVSAHFMVDRDGTIYRLMPETWMARHVIGLNYSSIGIENIGGENNTKEDLTPAQVQANIALVRYLKRKYPNITYLIGHHEYRAMESTPMWLEQDEGYRTIKKDPGQRFMSEVRAGVVALKLKQPPVEGN